MNNVLNITQNPSAPVDVAENLLNLPNQKRVLEFLKLDKNEKTAVFSYFNSNIKQELMRSLASSEIASILNDLSPDDRTQMLEDFPDELIKYCVNLLAPTEREIALNLLGYAPNSIARLMTPFYVQVKENWSVKKCLEHIKKVGQKAETINFIYVVDDNGKLIDDLMIGNLLLADENAQVKDIIDRTFLAISSNESRENAVHYFEKYDRAAMPIITPAGILVGIVTFDDIFDEIEQQTTEDIHKFGGLEALDLPYTQTSMLEMLKKRSTWLIILFISEMFTASAMGYFEGEIEKAVVLALFVPLIISSGGNSGSQAATLIIRAMALQELKLKDWWMVMRKEIITGTCLGAILGAIGFVRIFVWQELGLFDYGIYWLFVAFSVAFSLVLIVLWGTLSGSMIPFILKGFKLDPATSSAPFVATLVDVTGIIIYFTIAGLFLSGKLL